MIQLNISALIYSPVKQVFDFVCNPENDFKWQYGHLATVKFPEGINNIGTSFRSIGHLLGRRNMGTFEVTEYAPNKRYGFKSLSGPFQSQTSYTFEMADRGTKINISVKSKVINFFQMDEGVLEKRMKKQLKENLATLKDLLEVKRILSTAPN